MLKMEWEERDGLTLWNSLTSDNAYIAHIRVSFPESDVHALRLKMNTNVWRLALRQEIYNAITELMRKEL